MTKIDIPLHQMRDYEDDQISWKLSLPEPAENSNLWLNLGRLKRYESIAGLKHLTISSDYGPVSGYRRDIRSMSVHGTPIADRSRRFIVNHEEPLSTVDIAADQESDTTYTDFNRSIGEIKINVNELKERADNRTKNRAEYRDPLLWADLLNVSFADGIYKSAKENLLAYGKTSEHSRFLFYLTLMELGGIALSNEAYIHNPPEASVEALGLIAFTQVVGNVIPGIAHRDRLRNFRWSFLPGYNLDRVAASLVLPQILKVISVS